jgi:hypothetical protein
MSVAEKMTRWAAANGIGELQAVTLDTRSRLNDLSIGTQVHKGRFRIVRTVYGNTTTTVTPLSGWLLLSEAIVFLKMLRADSECLRCFGREAECRLSPRRNSECRDREEHSEINQMGPIVGWTSR